MFALCRVSTVDSNAASTMNFLDSCESVRCVELAPSAARRVKKSIDVCSFARGKVSFEDRSQRTMVLLCLVWMYDAVRSSIEPYGGLQ